MKRQTAFGGASPMLKGALHTHTTRSDGKGDPAEVIRLHRDNGYDFIALTDHRIGNRDSFGVPGITVLPGMELDASFKKRDRSAAVHCHHIVCLGPAAGGFAQDERFERLFIDSPEETQPMLDMLHSRGCLTFYAHPQWSGTPAREFETLRGNFAMEVYNTGCAMETGLDTDAAYWDELLAQGQRIFGVACDDGHEMYHHGNACVRVRSENSVPAILDALARGAFYASCGPEIYDFTVEDGTAHIACSPVREIRFHHLRTPFPRIAGDGLTGGSARLRAGGYIRASVMDAQGRRAWTNPIFLEDSDLP